MAAGLAHELNNPAAAARRAAAQMTEALDAISSALARFVDAGIEREQAEQLVALQQQAVRARAAATALDALDASDAEEELLARLEALGVERAVAAGRAAGGRRRRPGVARSRRGARRARRPKRRCAGWPRR